MVIFVAGASGYLGSLLVRDMSKKHQVIALIRRSSSITRTSDLNVNYVCLDDKLALENAFSLYKPDVIINTIALYGRCGESISAITDANVNVPAELLLLANQYNCTAFINTGTSLPDGVSVYSLTKSTFVKLAKLINVGIKFVNIELEHFYGPNDDSTKFISYIIDSCQNNNDLKLTSGIQKRDFIFIDDVISAFEAIVDHIDELESFDRVPVGSGSAFKIRNVVELIQKKTNSDSNIDFGSKLMRDNEVMYSCADIKKLCSLGWTCENTIEAGVDKCVRND